MKKLKRFVALLLAGVMAMALLTACGGGSGGGSKSFETQVEDAVFAVYSKAFGVRTNDAEMKKLAEKSLGYIKDGKFNEADEMNCMIVNGTTVSFALPIPDGNAYDTGDSYTVMEITPEILGQLKSADLSDTGIDEALKEYEELGFKITAIGVKAKTINNKTYVAFGVKMTIDLSKL